jgi:hypothetical protein
MKTALGVYIAMGVLTVVPLILFNIKKVWVRQPPDPPKFKWGRGVVILLLSALITYGTSPGQIYLSQQVSCGIFSCFPCFCWFLRRILDRIFQILDNLIVNIGN